MGKLIPLLAAGGGTATVSVGGFYLVNRNGLGVVETSKDLNPESATLPTTTTNSSPSQPTLTNQIDQSKLDPSPEPKLEFDSVGAFKSGVSNSKCVKDSFGEIIDVSSALDMSTESVDANSFLIHLRDIPTRVVYL